VEILTIRSCKAAAKVSLTSVQLLICTVKENYCCMARNQFISVGATAKRV